MNDNEIRSLFAQHNVPLNRDDVWKVQGTPVIKHSALERLSAALELKWDMPTVIRSERDECVVLARAARVDGVTEWSFGEALIVQEGQVGGNYKVSGKQASYVYAMAEKRAKDRVIIKLAGLHGAYSEEEADDFSDRDKKVFSNDQQSGNANQGQQSQDKSAGEKKDNVVPLKGAAGELNADSLKKQIDDAADIKAVTDLMLSKPVKTLLQSLSPDEQGDLRKYGKDRLMALGWDAKKSQAQNG